MKYIGNYTLIFFSLWLISCHSTNNSGQKADPLLQVVPSSFTGIEFNNELIANDSLNILEYDYYYNGGGVAAADLNNDGLTDLYFTGNQVSSRLYINKGNLRFEDVTVPAGVSTTDWATGVSVADVNADGLPDMYISFAGHLEGSRRKHKLLVNKGNDSNGIPVFKDEAEQFGIADTSYTTQSCFFDYDKDGDPDLLLANHFRSRLNPNLPTERRTNYIPESNPKLYNNEGGHFIDVSSRAGLKEDGYGLGVAISDINMDGWPDIFMAKDFVFDDALYINNGNGTFTESAREYLRHTSRFSMGCDIADFNNDSYPDIVTLDMMPEDNQRQKLMNIAMNNDRFNLSLQFGYLPQYSRNMLQLNNGPDGTGQFSFSEMGQLAGIYKTDWSWSPLFADFDNDGFKDLFVSNGIPRDITNNDFISYRADAIQQSSDRNSLIKELLQSIEDLKPVEKSNCLFRNNGNLLFSDMSAEWGMNKKGFFNGAVYADLDNDGDLDIVTNNLNDKATVYKNTSDLKQGNNYLRVQLHGSLSLGAKISVHCKGRKQWIEHYSARGFQSSQDPVEHFGLGDQSIADTVSVEWPDGKIQKKTNVKANQLVSFDYKDAITNEDFKTNNPASSTLFKNITSTSGIDFLHKEKPFEDFEIEPLLPHRFSQTGPHLAVADIDKNGYEDFWIGGPAKISGKLFLQQRNGTFLQRDMPDADYEDTGGIFFDANGDGYPDLYVVSGGNEYDPGSERYQDRLYLNDGKGGLKRMNAALPGEHYSGSCVASNDFDKDGDLDIFVGGSIVPGNYPFASPSLFLQNNGSGKFDNATRSICPELENAGLITTALWTDFDNDGWPDLVVSGEWMPLMFFRNNHGKLIRQSGNSEFDKLTGWWFSIAGADFDKDGDTDYLAGNLGLNNKFNVSVNTPLSVYAKDFDGNGTSESILTYFLNGVEYPVAGRDDIAFVMPSIKKQFDNYTKFANADFPHIFSKEQLQGAYVQHATCFASVYIENQGNGKFVVRNLPLQAQLSAVQSFQINDFDHDGIIDILAAGNFYSPDFMTGRYDASSGVLLKGDGSGNFTAIPGVLSGLSLRGDVRNTGLIKIKNKNCLVVAVNSGRLQTYQINVKK